MKIHRGALFVLTTGSYDEYQVHGIFRALQDMDLEGLAAEYRATCRRGFMWGREDGRLVEFLQNAGAIEPVPSAELNFADELHHGVGFETSISVEPLRT